MNDPLFARTAVEADQIQLIDFEPPQPDPQAIVDRLLDGEDISIVEDALFGSVVALVTRRRDECLNAQDVNTAEKCDDILFALRRMRLDSVRQAVLENREATMIRRLEAARLRTMDLEGRYRHAIDRVMEENRDHVAKLNERHREERETFEASWRTPQRTRLFSKASPALINLQRQNYMLLQARRYADQRAAKRQLDEMERAEIEERDDRLRKPGETPQGKAAAGDGSIVHRKRGQAAIAEACPREGSVGGQAEGRESRERNEEHTGVEGIRNRVWEDEAERNPAVEGAGEDGADEHGTDLHTQAPAIADRPREETSRLLVNIPR
jgi:hypothetical protein